MGRREEVLKKLKEKAREYFSIAHHNDLKVIKLLEELNNAKLPSVKKALAEQIKKVRQHRTKILECAGSVKKAIEEYSR